MLLILALIGHPILSLRIVLCLPRPRLLYLKSVILVRIVQFAKMGILDRLRKHRGQLTELAQL